MQYFLNQKSNQHGASLLTVMIILGVMSSIYYATDRSISNSIESQRLLLLDSTYSDMIKRTEAMCSSIYSIQSSIDQFSTSYATNSKGNPYIDPKVQQCLNGKGTCTSKILPKNEAINVHTGYAMNLFNHNKDSRFVGNVDCPAYYSHYGAINSTGSDLNRCVETSKDGFAVFGSIYTGCRDNESTCKVANQIFAKCTIAKLKNGTKIASSSIIKNISGFACPGTNQAVTGIDSQGQFICRDMVSVIGPKGDTGPQGDKNIKGPKGPDGKLFTTVRGNGKKGCFIEGTEILTQNGYKKIEALHIEDKVYNPMTKNYHFILNKVAGSEEKPMYHISTKNFNFIVTEDHPIKIKRNNQISDIFAKDVNLTDLILTIHGFESLTIIKKVMESNPPTVWNLVLIGSKEWDDHYVVANGIVTGDLLIQRELSEKEVEK